MLDDYKEKQSVAYNIMMNEILNNHISHAYLIDENNNNESFNIVMSFVKEILSSKLDSKEKEVLCKRIDEGNYPEIKVIEPDGMLIKKQQILDLQQEFSMAAVEGTKRIYVIKDADKMRSETANSMLKFLEEPDNDIVAILMTNNFNNLLPTIVSRCQVIRLNVSQIENNIDDISLLVLNFIKSIENKGVSTIIDEQELLFNTIGVREREKYLDFFDKMVDMYYDMLKILSGLTNIKYSGYYDELVLIANKNEYNKILKKIDLILNLKDRIKNNVNINLLIDNLIVNIGGINEGSWS